MKYTSIRSCEIVSNLNNGEEVLFDKANLENILSEKDCIKDYCYIIHDKDTYTDEDEKRNPDHKSGELKPAHIHLLLRFETNQPQKLELVAKWFNLKPNFVNKITGKWEDACLYQIHKNAPDKYQYTVEEVTANFDYQAFLDEAENGVNLKGILQDILDGNIREYNKTLEIDGLTLIYHAREINEAFKIRSEYLQATQKERNMECIFITGTSGCGKTTLAKKIADSKGLAYFVSSGSNDILDNFCQESVIIVDDVRPSCLGLSDLLKMLDPNTASSVKSRYKNKYLNCELIILTTVLDIDTFYNNVFSENDEPITQLKRRCGTYIKMDIENIFVSVWDSKTMRYTNPVAYKNNLLDEYIPKEKKTGQDVKNHVTNLMPFLELDADPEVQEKPIQITNGFHLEKIHPPETAAESSSVHVSEDDYKNLMPPIDKEIQTQEVDPYEQR